MVNEAKQWTDHFDGEMTEARIREIFDAKTHKVSRNAYPANAKFPGTMIAGKCFVLDGACAYIVKGERVTIKAGEFADLPQGSYEFEVSGDQAVSLVKVFPLPVQLRKGA
jgi:hypothetical protein